MKGSILGISAYYHDSAAALLIDGEIFAAAHEERFSRKKHDSSFPSNAVIYVLSESGLKVHDLEKIAFYDKPLLKFERLLESYHTFSPKGLRSFLTAVPVWMKEKLFMKKYLWQELETVNCESIRKRPELLFSEHHLSHAASAFYPSPFNEAAILTIDGVGEWATATIGFGKGRDIRILKELDFPHSLGLFYSTFTYYCGFRVNSGEYKLMGLAPYGNRNSDEYRKFHTAILDNLVDIREDGSILLNMNLFNFATGLTMCSDNVWKGIFGISKREPEGEITQPYMDLALAVQDITEIIVLKMSETARKITGSDNLVMSGGVALNCVANGKLLKKKIFRNIWIQPAAGDAGGALGAAYAAHYISGEKSRSHPDGNHDQMKGGYLGPEFSRSDILRTVRRYKALCNEYKSFSELCSETAKLISEGSVVGWFQGRMEWGPRALGNRSILADPRDPEIQKRLNLKIKFREGFRPFAPSVLAEDVSDYFELDCHSPYMLMVAPVRSERLKDLPDNYQELDLFERLYHVRSDIPAVTHVDNSARIQTVHKETNPRYWHLINAFKKKTGCGLLVNTSFNVRGEPIVCSPDDAYKCFMRTEMDVLVMGDFLFRKEDQPEWNQTGDWQKKHELD